MDRNRLINIIVYYNSSRLDSKFADSIGNAIIDLNLKAGDIFQVLPFNFLKDEDTNYNGEKQKYHDKPLKIESIDYTLVESWNGSIRKNILIHLTKK